MIILVMRTDKPDSEIGLFDDMKQLVYEVWPAHRKLAETLHGKIDEVLKYQDLDLRNIGGIICYKGPGSFTGLRIGLSTMNALAYALSVPIVGIENEEQWLERGLAALREGQDDRIVLPEYGAPVHITTPKK